MRAFSTTCPTFKRIIIQQMLFRVSCICFALGVTINPTTVFFINIMILKQTLFRICCDTDIPIGLSF